MNTNNRRKALVILAVYVLATLALLLGGYSVQRAAVQRQEFPFTVTYTYQGTSETISDIYVAEATRSAKYIGDAPIGWYGYVKDRNRLEADYYRVVEVEGRTFSINLNLVSGYLMGDPRYADSVCRPSAVSFDTTLESDMGVTDPAQLEALGFTIDSFSYPAPIENSFRFGGISLSSEATLFTAAIAIAALLACLILIRREQELCYTVLDKLSVALNFLVAAVAFPFILITSALSEIVADATVWQQLLYLAPALTALGVAASVTLRRMGKKYGSFAVQFAGPAVFALVLLLETL